MHNQIERLLSLIDQGETEIGEEATVRVDRYLDPVWARREQKRLFRARPLVLGHASMLGPGQVAPVDLAGLPVLAVRERDGTFRAFVNACRHRGMRLVQSKASCRSVVCPYHGWTYGLGGQLATLPAFEHFPSLDRSQSGLVPLPAAEAGELLWVGLQPGKPWIDLSDALPPELGGWLTGHVLFRESRQSRACNWKLVMDLLLDGYHGRYLQRDALSRPLRGRAQISEAMGPNVRIVSSRPNTAELREGVPELASLRACATVCWMLFPNTVLLFHTDSISLLQAWPETPERCTWAHQLLVPSRGLDEEAAARHARNWEALERAFQTEDLPLCEGIQSTLASGANEVFRLGCLEYLVGRFHAQLDKALGKE